MFRTMSTAAVIKNVKRSVLTNAKGYREVDLVFRKARALALEAAQVHRRPGRIHCPVLDASRTSCAYGMKCLKTTDQDGLDQWSDGLGLPKSAVRIIAYLSGPWYKAIGNKIKGTFDEEGVNIGLVKSLKKEVHTGIISEGFFDQEIFNNFIWTIHPNLKGTSIDNAFLHSNAADDVYVSSDSLETIVEHNIGKSSASWNKGLGPKMSQLEMEKLLLGHLGQSIPRTNDDSPTSTSTTGEVQAISVRDMHDLYKYGVFPVVQEGQLLEAGLIEETSVAITGAAR